MRTDCVLLVNSHACSNNVVNGSDRPERLDRGGVRASVGIDCGALILHQPATVLLIFLLYPLAIIVRLIGRPEAHTAAGM